MILDNKDYVPDRGPMCAWYIGVLLMYNIHCIIYNVYIVYYL